MLANLASAATEESTSQRLPPIRCSMGFVVRKTQSKKRAWKVGLQDRAAKTEKHVPLEEFPALGILPTMTFEEVKARLKSLNAQQTLLSRVAKRQRIDERMKDEALAHDAYLGPDVAEFEREVLFARKFDKKLKSHWVAVKRLICALRIDPTDWEYKKGRFYDYFSSHGYSVSYIQKLIPVINQWGVFQARKYKLAFLPLPYPTGKEREAINDAYFEKKPRGQAPAPLSAAALEAKKGELIPEQYNWLYLSVWFGLRPEEVANIVKGKHFELSMQGSIPVLAVFQTKLTSLARDQRWKYIPAVQPEQEKAIEILKSGKIKRPLAKTLARLFGERVGLRSGRKNFTDMMLDLGHPLEDISAWLGHTSIQRTWKSYRDRQKVRLTKKAA